MSIKDGLKGVFRDIARNTSRAVVGKAIQKFTRTVVDKIPDYNSAPKSKKEEAKELSMFASMVQQLVDLPDGQIDPHLRQSAKHILQRDPPETLCYDFLASLEGMGDEDINPLAKSMFNVKKTHERPSK